MTATAAVPASDETFGGYRILEVIGTGGMSVVYRAEQISLRREVALKVLAPSLVDDAEFRERFRREGRHVAGLEHPNIVTVHDCGEVDGRLYLAMRLVRGVTLAQLIRDGELSAEETVRLLIPIADALDMAAAANVVHRDVKPQNILVDHDGRPYLADFGVAKASTTIGSSATVGFVGTYNYAAPEQILGRPVTASVDVYGLTAVLFECLTGARPYAREAEPAVLHAHVNEPPPTVIRGQPGCDRCNRLIARGMAKRPAGRFASAGEMISEAAALVASLPASRRKAVPPFTPADHAPRSGDSSPGAATTAGSAVAGELRPLARVRWRARWVVAGVLASALGLALAVVLLTSGGAAAVHRPTTFTASLPPFVARYKRPWRQAARGTLVAGDATLSAAVSTRPTAVPGDVPPALVRSYGHPLASADADVAGHTGRRYEWSPLGESVVAYVLATPGGES
ncbi:MAG TPA: serine/threonine-protein kinase, partial [Solirubrobacteraceae bacterium]|nr:serine/threonine-protein kinase [Solirubrobacteraceae bacterium]